VNTTSVEENVILMFYVSVMQT